MVELLELGAGPLSHVLRLLGVQDLCAVSKVCRALHLAGKSRVPGGPAGAANRRQSAAAAPS